MALPNSNPDSDIYAKPTIYFGFGSNLWLHQMRLRCPTSKYLGVARLNGYNWIINSRGYANVVEVSSQSTSDYEEKYSNVVFGLVYKLQKKDERKLDVNEGVPEAYTKEHLPCDFWASDDGAPVDVDRDTSKEVKMLVYIDRKRAKEDKPKEEYVHRMNMGIDDAVRMGVPKEYVAKVMRRFIREEKDDEGKDGNSVKEKALRQAEIFVDEEWEEGGYP